MEIQTDQGLLVVNLENCITNAALQQIAKGDCIYTLAVASGDDSSTMVQIPVTLQCNGDLQHSFNNVTELQQQEAFEQVQIAEQLQCLLERNDQISQIQLEPLKVQSDTLIGNNLHTVSKNHTEFENVLTDPNTATNTAPALLIDYTTIFNYIHTGTVPSGASEKYIKVLKKRSQHYSIIDNTLYYGEKKLKKVIFEKNTQQEILRSFHIQKESGIHFGVRKMHSAIVALYFWQELYVDVTKFVRQCEGCSEAAVEKHHSEITMTQPDVNITRQEEEFDNLRAAQPLPLIWQSVEAQIHGPFVKTNRLNEYILTLSDPGSHWISALAIPDNNLASRMANFFFETFCVFGFTKCYVVSLSFKQFDAIQRKYQEQVAQIKDMSSKLIRKNASNVDCQFATQLVNSITSSNPANWDLEQEQFLFKYRSTAIDGGQSPFEMMFHRIPNRIVEENENGGNDMSGDESQHQYTSKRRRLQSSILQCRHCEDVFTSKVSFRIHQRKHMEDARRRGTLEGQEPLGLSGVAEKKLARSKALKKKQKLIRRHSQNQENSNRIDRLLLMMNRINSQRLSQQQVIPKGGHHEEMKANTVAAVKEILASTKEVRRRRGKYQKYPAELQEEMARFAIKHGNFEAVQHFTEKLGTNVSDSTIRNLVKLQRSFTPEIKEEIGHYAAAYGIEATSSLFTKRLGYEVRHGIVRKFKKQYSKHFSEISQKTKDPVTPSNDTSMLNAKKKVTYSTELRDEIGCYSTQFTIADTLQHFSQRLQPPLKKGTVRKFRKMYLEKHKPSLQESNIQQQIHLTLQDNIGPSTSQTIDILNASLNLLNNPQMNTASSNQSSEILNSSLNLLINPGLNQQSPIIYNQLSEHGNNVIPTPIRFHSFSSTAVPNTQSMSYVRQQLLTSTAGNHNETQFNHSMNNLQAFQQPHNEYSTLDPVQKHDSLANTVLLQSISQNPHHLVYSSSSSLLTQQLPTITLARSQPHHTYALNTNANQQSLLLSSCNMSLSQEKHDIENYNQTVDNNESVLQNNMPTAMVENLQNNPFDNSLPTLIADRDGTYTIAANINTDEPVTVHEESIFHEPISEIFEDDLSKVDLLTQNPSENIPLRSSRKKLKPAELHEDAFECSSAFEEDVDDPGTLTIEETSSPKYTKRKKRGKRKAANKKERSGKRGSYTAYSPEVRAEMGKYAAEHGSQCASVHFRALLGHDVPESTVRGLRDKYLLKREQLAGRLKIGSEVTSLGYSPRGRPMRLGKYDAIVQDCLRELVKSGEKVSSFLAIATAKQVLAQYEPGLLEENGGSTKLNVTWAKSFLKRIGVHNNS